MTEPRTVSAAAAPPHAPARGWSWRLLGPFHVTGLFWYRFHDVLLRVVPPRFLWILTGIFTTFFFICLR